MPDDPELAALKRELMAALRKGELDDASDTLLEVWAHHGIIGGNMAALDRFAIGSGIIQGINERKRVAKIMASQVTKLLSDEKPEEVTSEPDYAARLIDG
jgi:hypothetical protein